MCGAARQVLLLWEESGPRVEAVGSWAVHQSSHVQHLQGLRWVDNRAGGTDKDVSLCRAVPGTETAPRVLNHPFLELFLASFLLP